MKVNRTFSVLTKILIVTAISVGVHVFSRFACPPSQTRACEHRCEKLISDARLAQIEHEANLSKLSNLTTNLQSVRAQMELYRLHHNGSYPTNIADGLTKKTKSDGTVDAAGAYGPYMCRFPANPFVEDEAQAVKTSGADGEGWSYDPRSGVFTANSPGHEDM